MKMCYKKPLGQLQVGEGYLYIHDFKENNKGLHTGKVIQISVEMAQALVCPLNDNKYLDNKEYMAVGRDEENGYVWVVYHHDFNAYLYQVYAEEDTWEDPNLPVSEPKSMNCRVWTKNGAPEFSPLPAREKGFFAVGYNLINNQNFLCERGNLLREGDTLEEVKQGLELKDEAILIYEFQVVEEESAEDSFYHDRKCYGPEIRCVEYSATDQYFKRIEQDNIYSMAHYFVETYDAEMDSSTLLPFNEMGIELRKYYV